MSCASSCPTQDHESYGACLRSKNLGVVALESTNPSFSRNRQKAWDAELDAYAAARRQGIQPATTKMADINAAVEASQVLGSAFNAETQNIVAAKGV